MSLDLIDASKNVLAVVGGSGGFLAIVGEVAKRRAQKFTEKKELRVEDRTDRDALIDQLQEQLKSAEDRLKSSEERCVRQETRADHFQEEFDKLASKYRGLQQSVIEGRERSNDSADTPHS